MTLVNKLKQYLIASYHEAYKVTWPTKKQTINYSLLVIIMSLAVAAFFGLLDYILNLGLEKIL